MKNTLTFLTFILLIYSCQTKTRNETINGQVDSLDYKKTSELKLFKNEIDSILRITRYQQKIIDSLTKKIEVYSSNDPYFLNDPDVEEIKTLNHIFYHSVIMGRATPMARKKNGYAHLFLDRFIEHLKQLDIFDSTFLISQKNEFQECAEEIEEMKFEGTMDLGWEPRSCNFFNYYYYIGGQEPPEYYETKGINIVGNNASAQIKYFTIYEKKKHIWNRFLEVNYSRIDSVWRISKVRLTN